VGGESGSSHRVDVVGCQRTQFSHTSLKHNHLGVSCMSFEIESGLESREERRKKAMEMLTRTEQAASDDGGSADTTLRRTASDKERSRMEDILQSVPSLPSPSSPSPPCVDEDVEVRLEVQRRRQTIAASNGESSLEDSALRSDSGHVASQEHIAPGLGSTPKSGWDNGTTGSPDEHKDHPVAAGKQ